MRIKREDHQSDKYIEEKFNYEIKEIRSTNRDMRTYIDSVKKECETCLEHNTSYFENVATITVNSDSVIP